MVNVRRLSGSPAQSSPLTHPPVGPDYRHPSPLPLPIPITPFKAASRPTVSPSSPTASRRPQSLAGSYPLSLLHSRMSHAHRPHNVPAAFTLAIGSLGVGKGCPPDLRCPAHEQIPFDAKYYELYDEHSGSPQAGPSHSPWVGVVDVQQHYFSSFHQPAIGPSPPAYPGYRISARGQLQLIVKNTEQALKVFLVPYDLRALEPGGRLLVRERSYLADPGGREVLRYAVELQFLCVEAPPAPQVPRVRDSSTRRRMPRPPTPSSRPASPLPPSPTRAFYLTRTIRVVFPSRRPDPTDTLRVERADEVVPTVKHRRHSHAAVADEWRQVKADWAGAELDRGRLLSPVPVRREKEGRSRRGSIEDREISERLNRMALSSSG